MEPTVMSACSFITSTPRTQQQWLSAVPFISWLSMHIFEAVARVCLAGLSPHDALSLRELEVCRWAAEGKQVSDIAQILGITPRTVTFHLNNVVSKLGPAARASHFMGIEAGDGQVECGDGVGCQCG
jgi:LuxR family quorum-sensing system transcriptional regulator SolR